MIFSKSIVFAALAVVVALPSVAAAHSHKTTLVTQQQDVVDDAPTYVPMEPVVQIYPIMSMWWIDNPNECYTLWSDDVWRLNNGNVITDFHLDRHEIRRVNGRLLLGERGSFHGGTRVEARSMRSVTTYARKVSGKTSANASVNRQKSANARGGERSARQGRGTQSQQQAQQMPNGQQRQQRGQNGPQAQNGMARSRGGQPQQMPPQQQQRQQNQQQQNNQQNQNGDPRKKHG